MAKVADDFAPAQLRLQEAALMLSPPQLRSVMFVLGIQAEADMKIAAVPAVGPDMQFSGWPRLGRLRNFVKSSIGFPELTVFSFPYGGWIIAERGRRAGVKVPSRKRQTVILRTPWGPRTYSPGKPLVIGPTHGKRSITVGHLLVRARTPERMHRQLQIKLGAIYGG